MFIQIFYKFGYQWSQINSRGLIYKKIIFTSIYMYKILKTIWIFIKIIIFEVLNKFGFNLSLNINLIIWFFSYNWSHLSFEEKFNIIKSCLKIYYNISFYCRNYHWTKITVSLWYVIISIKKFLFHFI